MRVLKTVVEATVPVLFACLAFGTMRAQEPEPPAGPAPDLPRFLELTPCIATGAQPTDAGLRQVAQKGYQAVINLRTPGEEGIDFDKERKLVEELGLAYHQIPVVGKDPKDAQAEEFLKLMEELKEKKVFVHCAAANRVGGFILIERVLLDGVSLEQAQEEANKVGLKSEVLKQFALDYIKRHRDDGR